MTNKQKTLKACEELKEKYFNPQGKRFFTPKDCPLCVIHDHEGWSCRGCPLADSAGDCGCNDFKTFDKAIRELVKKYDVWHNYPDKEETLKSFINRGKFFEKIIPILEKIPEERFTVKGWTYFNELKKSW